MSYIDEILRAINGSNRSEREISMAAVGHDSAVRNLKRGQDLRVSTLEALCRELGIEFYVGQPRLGPPGISKVLELNYASTPEEAAAALELVDRLRARVTDILQAEERQRRRTAAEVSSEEIRKELEMFPDSRHPHWQERDNDYLEVPYAEIEPSLQGIDFKVSDGDKPSIRRSAVPAWASHADLVLIEAPDSSMKPTFEKGAPVLLDRSKRVPFEDELFLALYPFELAIRRVVRAGSGLVLCADSGNLEHPLKGFEPGTTLLLAEVAWYLGPEVQLGSIFCPLRGWPVSQRDSR